MASEKDMSLGEFLRHERESRCITIEQVASATKVGVRTLHALEEDQYADLPAKPFIRGFVTSYCRFIGVDAKETLARFNSYISQKVSERPDREAGHSGYAFDRKDGEQQGRTTLMIAIFGFILLGGLAMLFLKPSLRHHRRSHLDKLREAHSNENGAMIASLGLPVNSTQIPLVSPSTLPSSVLNATFIPVPIPSLSPVPNSNPLPQPTASVLPLPELSASDQEDPLDSGHGLKPSDLHHKVVFKILSDVWVRYQVDDKPIRKFIVRKGKELFLRAKDRIQVQVSNPSSVSYSYNGREFGLISDDKNAVVVNGNKTLFFPDHLPDESKKLFVDKADKLSPISSDTE